MQLTRRKLAAMSLLVFFPTAAKAASTLSLESSQAHGPPLPAKSLKLVLGNAWGKALNTTASIEAIFMSQQQPSWKDHFTIGRSEGSKDINCKGADTCNLTVAADHFRPATEQVKICPEEPVHTVRLMADSHTIVPSCPSYDKLPSQITALFDQCAGQTTYESLQNIKKAGFLGIMAKSMDFKFSNGRSVASYYEKLYISNDGNSDKVMIDQDRFYAFASPEIVSQLNQVVRAGKMEIASNSSHKSPEGYEKIAAYKSIEPTKQGILNINVHKKIEGDEILVEPDLDESVGLPHLYTVAKHKVVRRFKDLLGKLTEETGKSDPRELGQILAKQGIHPLWEPA